jgi:hypothetical protein
MTAITGGFEDPREHTQMTTGKAPVKTDQGHDEIAHRTRRLSQRHRTLLLLVDGRRDEGEILRLAVRAGVPESCYLELVERGLVTLAPSPQDAAACAASDNVATSPVPLRPAFVRPGVAPLSDSAAGALDDNAPAQDAVVASGAPGQAAEMASSESIIDARADSRPDSQSPAARYASRFSASGLPTSPLAPSKVEPDSQPSARHTRAPDSGLDDSDEPMSRAAEDRPLEEARELLIRAVTRESPVAGSLTLMRLRRASTRDEIQDLLDEVESRISRPRNREVVEQTLRRARHLLGLSSNTSFLMSR